MKPDHEGTVCTLAAWREYYNALAPEGTSWNFFTESYEPRPRKNPTDSTISSKEIGKIPSAFKGDTRTATSWALQLQAYMTLNKGIYETDEKRIILTLSLMTKGEAAKWAEAKLKKATADKNYGTFKDFTTEFKAMFFPKNIEQTAIKRISTLKQTGSVAAYVSLFHTIITNTNITDEQTKILFFRNGLKRDIALAILNFETLPATVELWMEKALDIEVRKTFTSTPSYSKAKDPYAMDIDRMGRDDEEDADEEEAPRARKTYLSPQEWEKRCKNGLCFKCGKKGLIKDCPNHPMVTTVKKTQTAVKPTTKTDNADYQEFLEWKAFKARQAKKLSKKMDFA